MNHQRPIQRSRIPKAVSSNDQSSSRCRSCLSPSSSPDTSYTTALPITRRNRILTALKADIGGLTVGKASLEAVNDIGHDGVTEDASVSRPRVSIGVEMEKQVQGLNSIRVVSLDENEISPPTPIWMDDDNQTIHSLDLPTLMADQNEFALYPRFGKLNCLNLLHLQQHLYELEQRLVDLDTEKLSSMDEEFAEETASDEVIVDMPTKRRRQQSKVSGISAGSTLSTRSVGFGGLSTQEKSDRETEGCVCEGHILQLPTHFDGRQFGKLPMSLRRCKLMGEVEKTLKAYNNGLLAYSRLIHLPSASHRDIRALKTWLDRSGNLPVQNTDVLQFLTEGSADVIAICARKSDILENFFQSRLLRLLEDSPMWSRVFPSIRGAVAVIRPTIQSRAMLDTLRFLISLSGALLIVAPVVVLYYTRDEWARLMIICVCTIVFAIVMHLFTASEKKEVLMATTGYTAVLVVFVGSKAFADTNPS